jgi:hypothetical protein
MTGGTRFRLWMQRAGADILSKEQIDGLCARFLQEAAADAGGGRIYVPTGASSRTENVRMAMKLADMGCTFRDCRLMLGDELSESTFYRWQRERIRPVQLKKAKRESYREKFHGGFVYAIGYEGVETQERMVKVGMSLNPGARMQSISTLTPLVPVDAALLAIPLMEEGAPENAPLHYIERECHRKLDYCRIGGEWFRPNDWVDEAATVMEEVAREHFPRFMLHRI